MGIEIAEKSKETKCQHVKHRETSIKDSNKHLYRSILSAYLPLIYGETTVFS